MGPRQMNLGLGQSDRQELAPGAWYLRDFVGTRDHDLWHALQGVLAQSPWRRMKTPGGRKIQVSMTACGAYGWISDAKGYRYSNLDPLRNRPWPAMPREFMQVAKDAATQAGYPSFTPDACLVNRYAPGMTMGMHQDADEHCFDHPIVSLSLGLDASFRFGGAARSAPAQTLRLEHGDAVVWGGPSRRFYHGVSRVYPGAHPLTGDLRINLTFRRAL